LIADAESRVDKSARYATGHRHRPLVSHKQRS
jgi:hypothetical protein